MAEKENREVYRKNLAAFASGYPEETEKFEKVIKNVPQYSVKYGSSVFLTDRYDAAVEVTRPDGRTLVLNGCYGKTESLEEEMEKLGKVMPRTPFFIVGLGNINRIREYLKAAQEDCLIIVYEPSVEIFQFVMETEDITDLILDSPVLFLIDQLNGKSLVDKLAALISIDTITSFQIVISENYSELFPEKVHDAIKLVKKVFYDMIVTWNTARRYTDVAGLNMVYNMSHMVHGYNITQLSNMLRGEIPAIVISAGPSLNKNIMELKAAQGKACLIAVDTAIKPLLKHGIRPDFFVIVDGKKPTSLMEHPLISEIPLVTCNIVAKGIMDLHKGRKFYYASDDPFEVSIMKEIMKEAGRKQNTQMRSLDTGGSVANSAFALAKYMNASVIILVGQDLALTNGRTHADGTFQDKMKKLNQSELSGTKVVEGIHGNKVLTRDDFYRYLVWFEDYIEKHEMKNVIDATQGGAKIHGTRIMSLRRAIRENCMASFDVKEKLERLPEMMDWGAKKKFKEIYEQLSQNVEEVAKRAKQGASYYRKMVRICEKEELDEEALRELSIKIAKVNQYMNENCYALFVQSNLQDLNFVMRMAIYQEEEEEENERIQLARQGLVMNMYIRAEAEKWMKQLEEILKERPISVTRNDIQGNLDELEYQLIEGK